ncbi:MULTISPECIES: DEAD/DEAH box helicase [Enterococcus]|uniref:DEAD/DEAH box helicase n=5 Tax=Enterococcus TaxID=1350 RepID=UPI00115EA704|nr:DEAD/DEAH box helicase [Enterococcus entomosocium]
MSSDDLLYLNSSIRDIRNELLYDIYNKKNVNNAFLSFTDLDIYSKDYSFFDRFGKAIRLSLLDERIILTKEQETCLNILSKENLFVSAPTSFGKTFIALEHIARNKDMLNNIIFVVPTIALMNELRRKCFLYFKDTFILITSDSELEQYYQYTKKIIIVVPERISAQLFQKYLDERYIDFLIYDEIYKLNADKKTNKNNSRLIKMNYIYKYLIERSKKVLLLGPFIKNVSFSRSKMKIQKFITNLNLVYNEVEFDENFESYYGNPEDKRFIYFDSPDNIVKFLRKTPPDLPVVEFDKKIVDWISENVHPSWYYVSCLKKGIGIHHGKTPTFLRKYIENEYAHGSIHTILCTSTLIEGVNTPTNSLVVYDQPRGVFELNNLIGRVGRLNIENPQPGKVYITKKETWELYNPNKWIELNILYEDEDILTKDKEDESLYLDKQANTEIDKNISDLTQILSHKYNIQYSDIIEAGIEFKILQRFIDNYDSLTLESREWEVIHDIKYKLLNEENNYLRYLKISEYSFATSEMNNSPYIPIDPVYLLLISRNGMKSVITKFTTTFPTCTANDINIFIDTLFKIDEFIKFKLIKIVAIYELFDSKKLFNPIDNRAFIQSINMIKNYSTSSDGYERILTDLGFPKEDILKVRNQITNFETIEGTEHKLKKLQQEAVFEELSPFGKKIIEDI